MLPYVRNLKIFRGLSSMEIVIVESLNQEQEYLTFAASDEPENWLEGSKWHSSTSLLKYKRGWGEGGMS